MIPIYVNFLALLTARGSFERHHGAVKYKIGSDTITRPLSPEVKVERLKLRDIITARETINDAFIGDPLSMYLKNEPDSEDPSFFMIIIETLYYYVQFAISVLNQQAFTINHGEAISLLTPAPASTGKRRPAPLVKLLELAAKGLWQLKVRLDSPEYTKRLAEYTEKMEQASRDNLGEKTKEMVHVSGLATSPKHQGKGYGTALLKAITDVADDEGRACYLESSNINNTFFYNSQGFYTVAEIILGEDNPNWDQKPIVVPIMVREARGKAIAEKAMQMV